MYDLFIENVGFFSLGLSALALYVSIRVAWDARFKPPKLIAVLSRIIVVERPSSPDSPKRIRTMAPSFWIRNLGAQPAIIEDLRLQFACGRRYAIFARPEAKFIFSRLTENSNITYTEEGEEIFPIDIDNLFTGFSLFSGELWEANYSFLIGKEDDYKLIQGNVEIQIQVRLHRSKRWKTIEKTTLDFKNRFSESKNPEKGFTTQIFYPIRAYR